MEYKVFIYIAMAAAYYGFQYWQKMRKNAEANALPTSNNQPYTAPQNSTPQTKIQDLLKEFGVDTYEQQPESTQTFEQAETRVAYAQKETSQGFELPEIMAKQEANSKYQTVEGKSLMNYNSPKIEKEVEKLQFDMYRYVEKKESILHTLKNKKGLQRALIISEILKPKF